MPERLMPYALCQSAYLRSGERGASAYHHLLVIEDSICAACEQASRGQARYHYFFVFVLQHRSLCSSENMLTRDRDVEGTACTSVLTLLALLVQ